MPGIGGGVRAAIANGLADRAKPLPERRRSA